MDFYNVWRIATPAEKEDIAKKLMTSTQYCSQLAHGHRKPSKQFAAWAAVALEVESLTFRSRCDDSAT
jgi:transcriptional regulator with XRE-family HTH domain